MEGHIADLLKTLGPNLTQSREKVTASNAGGRVIFPKKIGDLQKKRSSLLSLSQNMLFAIKMIRSKWFYQGSTALYICFSINKKGLRKPDKKPLRAVVWRPLL